jgi:hypothetical protein
LLVDSPTTSFSRNAGLSVRRVLTRWLLSFNLVKNLTSASEELSPSRENEFQTAIAYVVHETVRYFGMKEVLFFTRPLQFSKCLLQIIRYHAEFILGVHLPTQLMDKYNKIATTKELIHRQHELESLQHITDVYMAGFVVMDSQIEVVDNKVGKKIVKLEKYMSRLSVGNGDESLENFKKGFAIAALFHDIALLPKCEVNIESQTALDFLIKHSVLKEQESKQLSSWSHKNKTHALRSSYITLQQIELQNEQYAARSDFQIDKKEILLPAIRAILYHGCLLVFTTPYH